MIKGELEMWLADKHLVKDIVLACISVLSLFLLHTHKHTHTLSMAVTLSSALCSSPRPGDIQGHLTDRHTQVRERKTRQRDRDKDGEREGVTLLYI